VIERFIEPATSATLPDLPGLIGVKRGLTPGMARWH